MKIACTILITIISLSVMSGCVTQKKSVTADGYAAGILPDLTSFLVFGDYASSLSDAFTLKYKYTRTTGLFNHESHDVTEALFITAPCSITNSPVAVDLARELARLAEELRRAPTNMVPQETSE